MLNGIKILKLYAWEKLFQDKIMEKRSNELNILRRAAYLNSFGTFLWTCAPIIVKILLYNLYNKPINITLQLFFISNRSL